MKNHLLPGLDQALSALLDDLNDRGLLDETLVVAVGEMGRTPKSRTAAKWGRGHWSYCFPACWPAPAFAAASSTAAPTKTPPIRSITPSAREDLACTIYHALGIDPHAHLLRDKQGDRQALVDGGRNPRRVILVSHANQTAARKRSVQDSWTTNE